MGALALLAAELLTSQWLGCWPHARWKLGSGAVFAAVVEGGPKTCGEELAGGPGAPGTWDLLAVTGRLVSEAVSLLPGRTGQGPLRKSFMAVACSRFHTAQGCVELPSQGSWALLFNLDFLKYAGLCLSLGALQGMLVSLQMPEVPAMGKQQPMRLPGGGQGSELTRLVWAPGGVGSYAGQEGGPVLRRVTLTGCT